MDSLVKFFKLKLILSFILFFSSNSYADNHNIYETLELIQKDLKTLERAIYSGSIEVKTSASSSGIALDANSEDVLTRHLLKLSEIESQFRELTNRFEEINFKLDKLSNRLSKVQADNQIRFQDIENALVSEDGSKKITLKPKENEEQILPGSSQPQDLGTISYKDNSTKETSQQIQSVETTASIRSKNKYITINT
jgi:TolA-binding protein